MPYSQRSLVILKPTREIFATRFLGIVITLLVTIMALIYLVGSRHGRTNCGKGCTEPPVSS